MHMTGKFIELHYCILGCKIVEAETKAQRHFSESQTNWNISEVFSGTHLNSLLWMPTFPMEGVVHHEDFVKPKQIWNEGSRTRETPRSDTGKATGAPGWEGRRDKNHPNRDLFGSTIANCTLKFTSEKTTLGQALCSCTGSDFKTCMVSFILQKNKLK